MKDGRAGAVPLTGQAWAADAAGGVRRRAKLATLLRLPQIAIEHQRRLWVRDLSQKKRPQAGLAQTRTLAASPSRTISAAERAIAARSQSRPVSRATNRIFHRPSTSVSSSWPSVMRRT